MQRTDAGNQRSRETQRARILEGARRVFARKGKAATMADIAEAAGVSQGLPYRYFASKEEIYRELVEQAMEASLVPQQPAEKVSATAGERLALLVRSALEYRRDHPETYQLLNQALDSEKGADNLAELIRKLREGFFGELRRLIVEGQATGEVAADDPDQLVFAIAASLEGLLRIASRDPELFHRVCPDASILLRMLKPEHKEP